MSDIDDAKEMLGAGYPAAIIEQPHKRSVLRDSMAEEETSAWVKLSTAFKPHIKELRGAPLSVWLFLSLSINRDGVAFPAVRTIAEQIGYSHQGVLDAIAVLEEKGYLTVRRGERRYNLYEPEFASVGRGKEPSVNSVDQSENGQVSTPNRSTFPPDRSSGLDLNKRNKNNKTGIETANMPFDWKLAHGEEITSADLPKSDEALHEFERAFGFGQLPWRSKTEWSRFAKFVERVYAQDRGVWSDYVQWRAGKGKYSAFSNRKIRENPTAFMDTGYPEFEASKMYEPKTIMNPVKEVEDAIPNPYRKPDILTRDG